ncbi:MAG: alpha/beta hydrolase [Hyphomicrobium sp.]
MLSILTREPANAQDRWPPWQSYSEAEREAHQKALRRKAAAANSATALKRQVAKLQAAGKAAQAVPIAKRILALAEKKGANSLEVADALDTLAGLYEAQNQFAEAEPLLTRALAIREKAPGQPGVAASRERLAATYEKLGKSDAAAAVRAASAPASEGGTAAPDKKSASEASSEPKAAEVEQPAANNADNSAAEVTEAPPAATIEEPFTIPPADAPSTAAGSTPTEQPQASADDAEAEIAAVPPAAEEPFSIPSADTPGGAAPVGEPAPAAGGEKSAEAPMTAAPEDGVIGGAAKPVPPPPAAPEAAQAQRSPPAAASPAMPEFDGRYMARRSARKRSAPPSAASREMQAEAPPPPVAAAPDPSVEPPAGGSGARAAAEAPPPAAAARSSDPVGGAAAPANPDWQVVPVYWGTDRAVQPNAQRLAFGSDRARKLQLGMAQITVPKVHEVPNVERPWVVRIPYFDVTIYAESEDPKRHFTVEEIKALTKEELLAQVKARLKSSTIYKDQALVFVHGYNTSFDNALYRTAQIAYDLDFDGAPFLYSWPSGGAVASYTYDRESAQASEPYLREFLQMVAKETGAKQISIIAHSMGNQPVMDVLRDMKSAAPEGVTISQVILAAPDVDADGFANLASAIKGLAKNVTLYVAANDRALIVSRNFWGSYRAGDVPPNGPLILPGVDTIDVTAASTDAFAINHSGYASNNTLLSDIGELPRTGLRPPEMRALKPGKITTQAGDYWRYVPPPQ